MSQNNALPERSELDSKYKWNLGDLYPSDEAWEGEFAAMKELIPSLEKYKGQLADQVKALELFKTKSAAMQRLEKLFVYARMSRDQDNANTKYVAMTDRIYAHLTEVDTLCSYIVPELNLIPSETLTAWSKLPQFADFSRFLSEIVRHKPHVLSDKEERLLALTGDVANSYDNIFTMLSDVDMRFAPIKDENGNEVELSHGRYGLYMENQNREVRHQAYVSMYEAYKKQNNTLAALYSSNVKMDVFYARARSFHSALEGNLFGGDIPLSVYDSLIEAIKDGQPALHRYVALRKKLLGLQEMKMYDMYVPIVGEINTSAAYPEAQAQVKEALAPLGKEYLAALEEGFTNHWIDVYETRGKTSGAYAWGSYSVHPYMLLNYQGRLDDVFTLAHESGHALHSYFSDQALPYEKAQYMIFVAEVASTVNEVLLLKHLLGKTRDLNMRKYLLNHFLDQFRTTVFRQTMFAEFEKLTHAQAEKGESLTAEWMNGEYARLNREYYSDAVETDDYIATEWSRIPHFYNAFYVYQYATGFSAAVAIANMILTEGQPAVDRYLAFLHSGGSNSPIELLKIAGVDLSQPETVKACMRSFEETLDEFEKLFS